MRLMIMMKLIKKNLFNGIAWGCVAVIANIIIFDLIEAEFLPDILNNFTAFSIGVIAISIGFISTAVVYEIEQLRFRVKLLIHIVVGIGTLLLVGLSLDGFPVAILSGIATPINIVVNSLIVLAIWTFYYVRDKRELQKINEKIQERKSQKKLDTE